MLVQMLYGVWTNSLGLISDAMHTIYDFMVGWEKNERFIYGYGRGDT